MHCTALTPLTALRCVDGAAASRGHVHQDHAGVGAPRGPPVSHARGGSAQRPRPAAASVRGRLALRQSAHQSGRPQGPPAL
eukprot:9135421-Pyramimonas_sp.AAC.2